MRTQSQTRRRGGATLVESAMILSVFMMFMMGVFEYGRYIMLLQVASNAARTGVRYAVVNVNQPDNFDTVASGSLPSIAQFTRTSMGGCDSMIQGFTVTVFPVDSTLMYQDPPVIAPKSSYTTWKQATFTERIAVQITGNYQPILPVFVFFYTGGTNSVPIKFIACAGSEG